jgi:NAD(P)-dependent dehydrogenase (short-subunit alcohol dehydrogenase family)
LNPHAPRRGANNGETSHCSIPHRPLFRPLQDKLAALSAELGGAPFTAVDFARPQDVEEAVKAAASAASEASASHLPVTGLVYAVGSIVIRPLKATSAADFTDAFALNAVGAAMALKAAAPFLAAGTGAPGSAVLFSSVAARVGFPNHAAIAAAKGAVEGLTKAAAAELAPRVRVNAIAPSLTDTPLASRFLSSEAARKASSEGHPLRRVGTADELAATAEFLLDDASSGWMTGQVLCVDGGRSAVAGR